MQIEKNKKINEAIDLLIEGGVDLKTVLSQNGLNDAPRSRATRYLKKF
ncbi:hypothetical protein [Rickettsia endosymbiont of Urophora cardui]